MAKTMLGMPSPLAAEALENPAPPPEQPGTAKRSPMMGTMIGMPAPDLKQPVAAQTPEPVGLSGQDPAPPAARSGGKFGSTILGVAQPGIAPLRPGDVPAPPQSKGYTPPPSTPPLPTNVSTRPVPTGLDIRPSQKYFPTARPAWMSVPVIGGAMLAAAALGGGIAVLTDRPVSVTVKEFSIDEEGHDHLTLSCTDCPDGSFLELSGVKTRVKNGEAEIQTSRALNLGRNELPFHFTDLNGKTRATKRVILPIAFRILTNWDGREENPPYGEIVISAPAGSEVRVNSELLPVENQKASKRVVVDKESSGEERTSRPIEFALPVEVTIDGKKRETTATLKGSIAPLTLATPGPEHFLGGGAVTFSGQTAKGATVKAGDQTVKADENGTFSLTLKNPSEGEVIVSASTDHLLSRRLFVRLTKVAPSVENAKRNYDEVRPGDEVLLEGNVIESRVKDGTTRALLEVERGCAKPPCLLRANYAEPVNLRANRAAVVSGVALSGDPLTVRVRRFH